MTANTSNIPQPHPTDPITLEIWRDGRETKALLRLPQNIAANIPVCAYQLVERDGTWRFLEPLYGIGTNARGRLLCFNLSFSLPGENPDADGLTRSETARLLWAARRTHHL
jgi:hypothetical protein